MMDCAAIVFVVEDKEEMTETLIIGVTFYVRAVVAQKSLVV